MNFPLLSVGDTIDKLPMRSLVAVSIVLVSGCTALLPSSKEETISAWRHFHDVKSAYDRISPGETTEGLKSLGFDIANSPNVQILNYLDVAAMVQGISMGDLDPGLRECLQARDDCQAYVYDLRRSQSKRVGNFWSDFLNFRRKSDITGWQFKAFLVLVSNRVVYKLWSGTPALETYRDERNPLGPLQGSGNRVLDLWP